MAAHLCSGTRGGGGEWLVGLRTAEKVVEFAGDTFPMALAASRAAINLTEPGRAALVGVSSNAEGGP